jgi:hypothetical protein
MDPVIKEDFTILPASTEFFHLTSSSLVFVPWESL